MPGRQRNILINIHGVFSQPGRDAGSHQRDTAFPAALQTILSALARARQTSRNTRAAAHRSTMIRFTFCAMVAAATERHKIRSRAVPIRYATAADARCAT